MTALFTHTCKYCKGNQLNNYVSPMSVRDGNDVESRGGYYLSSELSPMPVTCRDTVELRSRLHLLHAQFSQQFVIIYIIVCQKAHVPKSTRNKVENNVRFRVRCLNPTLSLQNGADCC